MATSASLVDRIRRLEEALNNERQIRENLIHEERRTRDREVRILREALHPFYKSEEDMRRKLLELEDHLEGNYDEYIRLRDRIVTVDDANMTLEKRIDELEGSRKRRRVSRDPTDDGLHSGLTSKRGSNPSSSDDKLYPRPEPRRRLSPARRPPFVRPEPESPRSSGILNLVKIPRSPPPAPPQQHGSPPSEGARSSGFLALDLAERFNRRMAIPTTRSSPPSTAAPLHPPTTLPALHSTSHSPPDARDIPRPNTTQAPGTPSLADPTRQILLADTTKRSTSVEVMEISPTANGNGNGNGNPNPNPNGMAAADADSPKKRKRDPQHLMALDVLANVSVASPLA